MLEKIKNNSYYWITLRTNIGIFKGEEKDVIGQAVNNNNGQYFKICGSDETYDDKENISSHYIVVRINEKIERD